MVTGSRRSRFGLLALAGVMWPFIVFAQGVGPFAELNGSWSGSGTVTHANGATERLRCDAQYDSPPGGQILQQTLNCRSDNYVINVRANLTYQGGPISGSWVEVTRNAQGSISGQASRGQIRATIQGPGFAAGFGLSVRGNQQSVSIRSQGTEVAQVSIVLRRTGRRTAALL